MVGPLNVLTEAASDHRLFSVILVNILQVFFFDHKVSPFLSIYFWQCKTGTFWFVFISLEHECYLQTLEELWFPAYYSTRSYRLCLFIYVRKERIRNAMLWNNSWKNELICSNLLNYLIWPYYIVWSKVYILINQSFLTQ